MGNGSDDRVSCQRLFGANFEALVVAEDEPAALPARRNRAPRARPTIHVTTEQCQWLTETVEDSMRWLLHEEKQQIDDDNAFPRIWCAGSEHVLVIHCACVILLRGVTPQQMGLQNTNILVHRCPDLGANTESHMFADRASPCPLSC